MSLIVQLKRKATHEENNAAESSDCMIVTTGVTGNPLLTQCPEKLLRILNQRLRTIKLGLRHLRQMLAHHSIHQLLLVLAAMTVC
uniref:Uncharacterized protein n=1 Tax=Aegilops tauschii subsp. strangulata TaxID=200361 RepID=A0A453JU19_AEGTS